MKYPMESRVARVIAIALFFVLIIISFSCAKPMHKMTGKESVQYNNDKYLKFNAYKKPRG